MTGEIKAKELAITQDSFNYRTHAETVMCEDVFSEWSNRNYVGKRDDVQGKNDNFSLQIMNGNFYR